MAFNEVEARVYCASCKKIVTAIFQTYAASSFDAGQYMQRYALGSKLNWVSKDDPDYASWRDDGAFVKCGDDIVEQACPGHCSECTRPLGAIVRFEELQVVRVGPVFTEDAWPNTHPRF